MSNAAIERQTLLTAQLVFSDAEALVPKIAATVNDEVSRHHEVIAGELKTVGAAAFMKLIPTHRNLHRHVAVLLPEYDAAYRYKRRATAWKTEGRPARPKRGEAEAGRGSAFIQAHGGSAVRPRPPRASQGTPRVFHTGVTAPPRCPAPTASPGRRAARPTRRMTRASLTSGER